MAREHADINQRSGVSVRMSIANYESMIGNAYAGRSCCVKDEVVPRSVIWLRSSLVNWQD